MNINPEIEEKLLNLQRCHEKQMKGSHRSTSVALASNHHEYSTSPAKYSNTSRKHLANRTKEEDDEWFVETPKRRPPRTISSSDKRNASAVESNVNRIIRSVAQETTPTIPPSQIITTPTKPIKSNITPVKINPSTNTKVSPANLESKFDAVANKKESEKKKNLQVLSQIQFETLFSVHDFSYFIFCRN